eukprot:4933792-Pyramimonas_sp.AAC.2
MLKAQLAYGVLWHAGTGLQSPFNPGGGCDKGLLRGIALISLGIPFFVKKKGMLSYLCKYCTPKVTTVHHFSLFHRTRKPGFA